MNRSPRVRTAGASRRIRTYADLPGSICAIVPALPSIGADRYAAEQLRRALMETHARSVAQRSGLCQQFDDRIEALRGLERTLSAQRVAARDVSNLNPPEIHGDTMTRAGLHFAPAMHLQSTDLDHALAREHDQLGLVVDRARDKRASHDRAKPFDREHPIDRQPNLSVRRCVRAPMPPDRASV